MLAVVLYLLGCFVMWVYIEEDGTTLRLWKAVLYTAAWPAVAAVAGALGLYAWASSKVKGK